MQIANIEFVPKVHSDTGASGLYRWRADHCPGSVRLIREKAPPELDIEDEVKDDGIEAHGFAERMLTAKDVGGRAVLKATFNNHGGDSAMFWGVTRYVDYVLELATLPGAQLMVEERFVLDWLADDLYGTADAVIYAPNSRYIDIDMETGEVLETHEGPILHVIDFKYGFVAVDAKENDQGLYYALGAYARLRAQGKRVNRVVIHIFQPRAPGRKSSAVRWSCDEAYLEAFALRLKDDKLATDDPEAPLRADAAWCRLCKARTVCPELTKPAYDAWRAALVSQGVAPASVPSFEAFMNDRALQYKAAKLAEIWCKGVLDRTRSELILGEKITGLKLVAPVNRRYVANVEEVLEKYPPTMFPKLYETPELKSAAQILEGLKGSMFADPKAFEEKYVRVSKPGKPLVAPVDDKRPEWNPTTAAANEWADEIQEATQAQPEQAPPAPPVPPAVPALPANAVSIFSKG